MSGSTRNGLARRILGLATPRRRAQTRMTQIEGLENRWMLSSSIPEICTSPALPKGTLPPKSTSQLGSSASSPSSAVTLAPLSQTFFLNSRPSATKTIYLDFNGNTTSNTLWNSQITNGADIVTPAYSLDSDHTTFSNAELIQIQLIWQQVVEDFAPFDVNVTTQDPGTANLVDSGGSDTRWGMRVVIGGFDSDWLKAPAGGVAFIGTFDSPDDICCFVFSETQGNISSIIADDISHETGHTLGLNHDGTISGGPSSYYTGQGTGVTSWAPIMGGAFFYNVVQWSKGEYPGANNKEDDLQIITTQNGFGYRPDDYGNTLLTATQLSTKKTGGVRTVNTSGVIERNTDTDWFSFTTTGGAVNLNFDVAAVGADLDMSVSLYKADGTFVLSNLPAGALGASITTNLPAGQYFVMVDGVGFGNLSTGYSDYGSLGQYTITGSFADTSSGTATGGTSVISGKVLSDVTNTPISGVVVFIDLDGNGTFNAAVDKSARTDATGTYQFTGLLGSNYQIYQVVPSGWQQLKTSTGTNSIFVPANGSATFNFTDGRPPILTGMNTAVSYPAGSTAVLLTPNADVTDADTTVFKNARLNVSLTANGDSADVLSIRNQGNGAGQVGYFGGVVRYSGVAVGTVTGGTSGSNLIITFNSSATLAIVKAILKNLTFSSSASTTKSTRTVSYSLSDGTGAVSTPVTNLVKVT